MVVDLVYTLHLKQNIKYLYIFVCEASVIQCCQNCIDLETLHRHFEFLEESLCALELQIMNNE